MFRLGLTGGVGSGKSTVAGMLAALGAGIIDADAISRKTTAPDGQAIEPIRLAFGHDFITADNGLDRQKIRQIVFSDTLARKKLEAIVHPLVQLETRRQSLALQESGCPCVVLDVPLLIESAHWRQNLDKVLVIDCSPEVQIRRTSQRSGLSAEAVTQIINAQASRHARLSAADMVLYNDSLLLEELAFEVRILSKYCGL